MTEKLNSAPTKAEKIQEVDNLITKLEEVDKSEALEKLKDEWERYKENMGEKIGDVVILAYKMSLEELVEKKR